MSELEMGQAMSLAGQVALVTGGGTGIGFMIAKGFAVNGAKVYISGRREQVLKDAAASVTDITGSIVPLLLDVTDQKSIDEAVKIIAAADGKLNVLVNNAGIAVPKVSDPDFAERKMANFASGGDPLNHESFEGWSELFTINSSAPFFMIRAFQDLLIKGSQARSSATLVVPSSVINISSVAAGIESWLPMLSYIYNMTKAAVDKLTVGLATDYAQRKVPIRVNAIRPGMFPSEIAPPEMIADPDLILPGYIAGTPARRPGTPVDMARAATFLATSDYVTGEIIKVDGGMALVNP